MGLVTAYHYLFHELGDQRFKDNVLTDTPWLMLAILLVYYGFCRVWGPNFMKGRNPFNIKWLITVYNITQIIWNCYMVLLASYFYPLLAANILPWYCFPIERTYSPVGLHIRFCAALYFYNKLFDLCDTIFMVLRKKNRQISSLHLSHHMIMVAGIWFGLKYHPGGNGGVVFVFNPMIHVLMYIYYQLSLVGYDLTLTWKPHLTMLQMAQFGVVFLVVLSLFVDPSYCGNDPFISVLCLIFAGYFIYTFSQFYVNTYLVPERQRWDAYEAAFLEQLKKKKELRET